MDRSRSRDDHRVRGVPVGIAPAMTLLSFSQVTKRYPRGREQLVVLNGVSLEIESDDYIGLWGTRRSGKSTLLRIAAGIEQPDAGSVCWDGRVITEMSAGERARLLRGGGIGLASTDWHPQPNHRALEHVALPLLSDHRSLRGAKIVARRALDRVDAGYCADLWTHRLSLGELMRVALARALVRAPRLLLVDEPAVLPSPTESEELYALLRNLGRSGELAVVVASEDLAAIQSAPRMLSIAEGTLRSMDSSAVVLPFPRLPARADDARP
jgi:predicted ABC-type transport system involved in lysophospholipase L1 biosynthesis ATPase subunit